MCVLAGARLPYIFASNGGIAILWAMAALVGALFLAIVWLLRRYNLRSSAVVTSLVLASFLVAVVAWIEYQCSLAMAVPAVVTEDSYRDNDGAIRYLMLLGGIALPFLLTGLLGIAAAWLAPVQRLSNMARAHK